MRQALEEMMCIACFPEEAQAELLRLYDRIAGDECRMRRFMQMREHFWAVKPSDRRLDAISDMAVCMDESPNTLTLLFYLSLTPELRRMYKENNIPDFAFPDMMRDLYCKLHECKKRRGVWGSEVGAWFDGFFRMTRFALGRLQFEHRDFPGEDVTVHGVTVRKGESIITIHIPSAGPLTKEKRLDSYRKAFEFYRGEFGGSYVPIMCQSWLIYPRNEEFFPEGSNVISFMHDFRPVMSQSLGAGFENFGNCWRVFYKDGTTPVEEMPRDTRLQRAYIDWFAKGGDSGSGTGILIADEYGIHID